MPHSVGRSHGPELIQRSAAGRRRSRPAQAASAERQLVVELDRLGQLGVARTAGTAAPTAWRRTRRTSRVASLWNRRASCTRRPPAAIRSRASATRSPSRSRSVGDHLAGQGRPQRLAEVALDLLAPAEVLAVEQVAGHRLLGRALDRLGGGVGDEQRAGRVEHARCSRARGRPRPGAPARRRGRDIAPSTLACSRSRRAAEYDRYHATPMTRMTMKVASCRTSTVPISSPPPGTPRTRRPHRPWGAGSAGSPSAPAMTVS